MSASNPRLGLIARGESTTVTRRDYFIGHALAVLMEQADPACFMPMNEKFLERVLETAIRIGDKIVEMTANVEMTAKEG